MILYGAEIHARNTVQQLGKTLVALGHGGSQLVAVDIEVIEQTCKTVLRETAFCGVFNVIENQLQKLVYVVFGFLLVPIDIYKNRFFIFAVLLHVAEQFQREDKEPPFLPQVPCGPLPQPYQASVHSQTRYFRRPTRPD